MTFRTYRALTLAVSSLALSSCQLFGGASDDPMQELRQQVRTTVTDPEREVRMLESNDSGPSLYVADLVHAVISGFRIQRSRVFRALPNFR